MHMGVDMDLWLVHHLMRVHWDSFHDLDFKNTTELVFRVGCKLFLTPPTPIFKWDNAEEQCVINLRTSPFMHLPQCGYGVNYSNILIEMLRSSIEKGLLKGEVSTAWPDDILKGP